MENGQILVRNEYTVTEEDLYEVISRRAWVSAGVIVPLILLLAGVSYAVTFSAISRTYQAAIAAGLFGAFFLYWIIHRFYVVRANVKNNAARLGELNAVRFVSELYTDHLSLSGADLSFCLNFTYDQIKKVVRTRHLIAVCTAGGNMLLFKKDHYTVANGKTLVKLLKQKCGKLRFYGFPAFKKSVS